MSTHLNSRGISTRVVQHDTPSTQRAGYLLLEQPIEQRVRNLVQTLLNSNLFPEETREAILNWEREFIEKYSRSFPGPEAAEALCYLICRMIRTQIAAQEGNYTIRARLGALEAQARILLEEALPQGSNVEAFILEFESLFPEEVQLHVDLALTGQALSEREREERAFFAEQNALSESRFTATQNALLNHNEEGGLSAQERERIIDALFRQQTGNQTRMDTMAETMEDRAAQLETQQKGLGNLLSKIKDQVKK